MLGKVTQHELKPGGAQIAVSDENKEEYLELITQWFFSRGVEEQLRAFMEGFNDVIPQQWLQYFDEKELEARRLAFFFFCILLVWFDVFRWIIFRILVAVDALWYAGNDVNDWARNTVYRNYTKASKQVVWFWQVRLIQCSYSLIVMVDWLILCSIDWSIDWLIGCVSVVFVWSIDWLIDCVFVWSCGRLIDWLISEWVSDWVSISIYCL